MSQKTAVQLKEQLGAVDLLEWQRDVADSAWLRADLPDATTDEMEAGTETDPRAMSPADVAAAIAALGGGNPGYLEYVALLTQTGTNAPVATVLANTLGGTPVFARSGAGIYTMTLTGAWVDAKTALIPGSCKNADSNMQLKRTSADVISIYTMDIPSGFSSDALLVQSAIVIRVYP